MKIPDVPCLADEWRRRHSGEGTGPEEPPIPPHVTFEQMEALTKAFVGAPREGLLGVMEAAREFIKEFKPGE